MSESVFVGLCVELGTSQHVDMRRNLNLIRDMVDNQVLSFENKTAILIGSEKDGFRLKGSDRDVLFWPNNYRVIWELFQSQYYNTNRQELFLCDCSDSPPGYTLLYLLSPSMNRSVQSMNNLIQRACVRMNNKLYISSSKYRKIMCSAVSHGAFPHGPCISKTFPWETKYDFVLCFMSDFWPLFASTWRDRCHSWPLPCVVDEIVKNGCHLVAVGHKLGSHEHDEWRISFSTAEYKLVWSMNHCQFLTYGLLKLFLTEIINHGISIEDKILCSYHIKTAIFWVIQQNMITDWCPQTLLDCFWVCFKLIIKWVYEGVCPNFFIPQNNMFLGKVHGEAQHQLFIRLFGLYEKGLSFLLHSSSITGIINYFHDHKLVICPDEHNLISEAEFDKQLFSEIYSNIQIPVSNIKSCMRYLHTIEQMINLPLLTQYQIVMLQKLTPFFLQKIAFILCKKKYTHKNKLRYRADKLSCHMLKLAAMFGCISDMLYIAMYYYKTLKYTKALSIIEMTKVKLAQPYVIFSHKLDRKRYTEAVGGQSWSTKMRQAVAFDIGLHNDINYISELIPEQQSALNVTERNVLTVSPYIMLYMLEILCFRHVNTIRAQKALNDLQTLVHNDQGQHINLCYSDISWQILGICQQLTGNLQAALYSYQQSLEQRPFHKIQTATEWRRRQVFDTLLNK